MVGYLKVLCFSGIAIPSVGNSTSYPFAVGSLEVKNGDKVLICRPGDTIFSNAIALVTVTDELSNTAQTNWLMEASSGGGLSEVPTVIIRDHTNPIPVEGSITSFPYTMVSGASNNGKIYGLTPTSKTFAVIFWTYQNVKAIGCGYFHSVSNGNKYYFNILEVFQTS